MHKPFHLAPGISMHIFLKEAKWKQKWTTFARIHRLTCQQNTLVCAPTILKHRFSRSLLIGTPVDFKRFEKRSVPTIDAKGKDSLDNDYPRNKGRLANRFSPINVLWKLLWDPTGIQNPPPPPPPQRKRKNDFLSNWRGLFEICFQSSKMTDPRLVQHDGPIWRFIPFNEDMPKWTNNKLSTAKIDIS